MAANNSLPTIDMFQPLDGWFDSRAHHVRVKILHGRLGVVCRSNSVGDVYPSNGMFSQMKKSWMHFPDLPSQLHDELAAYIATR